MDSLGKKQEKRIKLPLKRSFSMIASWASSRILEQAKAVLLVVGYLAALQLFILKVPIQDAFLISLGVFATIFGLALFLEGLFLGIMPLGEQLGMKLPGRGGRVAFVAFAFVLGITATFAEPAIGFLQLQGGAIRVWENPLLFLLLNRGSPWLIAAIAAGVGIALVLGLFRFLHSWTFKPFIFYIVPPLLLATAIFGMNPNLAPLAALAWDAGGITTGPVTVPLVIALGMGMARRRGTAADGTQGLGVVTLASLFPVAAVMVLSAALLPFVPASGSPQSFFSDHNRNQAVFVAGSPENLKTLARKAALGGFLTPENFASAFPVDAALSESPVLPVGDTAEEPAAASIFPRVAIISLRAVLPLVAILLITLVALLRQKVHNADELVLGIVFAVAGMFFFSIGMEKGLTSLGVQSGKNLSRAWMPTARSDKKITIRGVEPGMIFRAAGKEGTAVYLWVQGAEGLESVPFEERNYDAAAKTYEYVPIERAVFGKLGQYGAYGAVFVLVMLLGIGVTLAEPSLRALGVTIEDASTGTYRSSVLVRIVALGVGIGMAAGFAAIVFRVPLIVLLGIPYALALVLTLFSTEDFAAIAWDAAGVTTGPVTVPLVIACGLGIGQESGANGAFGVVGAASVFPVVAVLLSGLIVKARAKRTLFHAGRS